MVKLGIESLLEDKSLLDQLKGKRVALLAHPASVNSKLEHSMDLLMQNSVNVVAAFGPQHGMRGEKQDNMIESDDYLDPKYNIPIFSLYGKVRYPSDEMMKTFDVILVDLLDVGCRIYTFITTLFYVMDACEKKGKELWVLDRPNPAGRPVEGSLLREGFESFVGAAPIPMRHGLTLGEAALWFKAHKNFELPVNVVKVQGYNIHTQAWPQSLSWVNPSPNMPRLSCVEMYAGTVMVEGSNLSEGRGTTIPLEILGHPDINAENVIRRMQELAPEWLKGCLLRDCYFEPTFHKFNHQLCSGIQVHVDGPWFDANAFKPYRLISLAFKVVHELYPNVEVWRQPPYEYEEEKMPIDILSGSTFLRQWVADLAAKPQDLEEYLSIDEKKWLKEREPFLLY